MCYGTCIYIYKQDLALNNLQGLICHEIQPNQWNQYCKCFFLTLVSFCTFSLCLVLTAKISLSILFQVIHTSSVFLLSFLSHLPSKQEREILPVSAKRLSSRIRKMYLPTIAVIDPPLYQTLPKDLLLSIKLVSNVIIVIGQMILPFIQKWQLRLWVLLSLVILKGRMNELTKILIVFNLEVLLTVWDERNPCAVSCRKKKTVVNDRAGIKTLSSGQVIKCWSPSRSWDAVVRTGIKMLELKAGVENI